MFHRHSWEKIKETYAPRREKGGLAKDSYYETDNLTKIALGVTTLAWQCKECQDIKVLEMLGK